MKDLAWINLMKAIDSLFDKFTKEEKNDTYTFQGVVGIDRNVRVFVVPESSILNIICDGNGGHILQSVPFSNLSRAMKEFNYHLAE